MADSRKGRWEPSIVASALMMALAVLATPAASASSSASLPTGRLVFGFVPALHETELSLVHVTCGTEWSER